MPEWVNKWICGYLARILRMHIPVKEEEDDDEKKSLKNLNELTDMTAKSLLANVLDINDDFGVITKPKKSNKKSDVLILKRENSANLCDQCNDNLHSSKNDVACRKLINTILKELKVLTKKIQDDAEDEEKELNWKFAAMVIDRLCMWIFAIATFFSTTLILLTSKNFFKFK